MALSNQQYDSIMRQYEERRARNRGIQESRLAQVYGSVAGYRELDEAVAAVSVGQARKFLAGDGEALSDLHERLQRLTQQKARLLAQAGYPADFLEPLFDCPDCRDTGYVGGKKCHCFRQAQIALLCEQSNLQDALRTENFDRLSYDYWEGADLANYRRTVEKCHSFCENFGAVFQNLFFYGKVGTGKTFLTCCIAGECLRAGRSVLYFSSANLFDYLMRSAYDYKSQEEVSLLLEGLISSDLLVLDDLGTEITNPTVLSHLFTCINERLLRQKPTLISTNLSLEDCKNRYQDRIFSRLVSEYDFCKLTGPDIRLYRKKRLGGK